MPTLTEQLQDAETMVVNLRQRIAATTSCRDLGHDWKHIGGCNAGCDDPDCCCSIPVHTCSRCEDCDYGQNSEADHVIAQCLKGNREWQI